MRKALAAPVLLGLALSAVLQPVQAAPVEAVRTAPADIAQAAVGYCGATGVAHRGPTDTAVENTAASIHRAAELSTFVEMDLTLTTRGVKVFMHDSGVGRVTDGAGPVETMRLAEIQALSTEPYDGKVMVFAAFMNVMQSHPKMMALVEIKRYPMYWQGNQAAFEDIQADLERAGLLGRVYMGGEQGMQKSMQMYAPKVRTYSMIVGDVPFSVAEVTSRSASMALTSPLKIVASVANDLKARGIKVWSSKAETAYKWRRAIDAGATAVVTDHYKEFNTWCRS